MLISEMHSTHPQEIKVTYAAQEHVKPGRCCGPVVRAVYIIECCTGGKGSVIINGKEFPFGAGQAYVLLPGDAVKHTADIQDPRSGFWCALDGVSISNYLQEAGITSDSPFISPTLFEEVRHWLRTLVDCWKCQDTGAQLRQTACAYGLLGAILQNRPVTKKDTWLDRATGYMQTNYPEQLSVEMIAEQAGLERAYFSAQFKRKTGISPHQYLNRLRIEKACQLLKSSDYSVTDVAYLVGLQLHNFSRTFKREMGVTPQEYQQEHKKS